jgi:hypothetical protein
MNLSQAMTPARPLVSVSTAWLGLAFVTVIVRFRLIPLFPHPYWAYMELLFVGLIPVSFSIFRSEDWSRYGISRMGLASSIAWSLLYVAVTYCYYRFEDARWMWRDFYPMHSTLSVPATIYYALLEVFSYGPLEVFFIVWLVRNTEDIFFGKSWSFLVSLTVTAILYGLSHFIFQPFIAALEVGITSCVLILIFKHTKNSIGPMIAWSLINGQVWQGASMLWS